jgi:hypothetical protein
LFKCFEAAGNGGFLFGVSSVRMRSCSSTSYVSRVNDLALVDNGPLTSMAVLPDGLVARKARGVPIPMKYRTKACAELFPSPRHRPAAIGMAINNFKQISRYQRSFFLTGRR